MRVPFVLPQVLQPARYEEHLHETSGLGSILEQSPFIGSVKPSGSLERVHRRREGRDAIRITCRGRRLLLPSCRHAFACSGNRPGVHRQGVRTGHRSPVHNRWPPVRSHHTQAWAAACAVGLFRRAFALPCTLVFSGKLRSASEADVHAEAGARQGILPPGGAAQLRDRRLDQPAAEARLDASWARAAAAVLDREPTRAVRQAAQGHKDVAGNGLLGPASSSASRFSRSWRSLRGAPPTGLSFEGSAVRSEAYHPQNGRCGANSKRRHGARRFGSRARHLHMEASHPPAQSSGYEQCSAVKT